MKKYTGIVALVLIIANTGFSQVNFEKFSFQEALEKADREGKKVFVDVYTTWCAPCKRMDLFVFSNKAIGERMSKEYVALKVDYENSPYRRDVSKYWIKGYPTMLVLDSKGLEIGRIFGARPLEVFNKELDKFSKQNNHQITQAVQNMNDNPGDQKIWKASLSIMANEINLLYRHDLDKVYKKACEDYYKNFDVKTIDDVADLRIFENVELPLEHPVVQQYLIDSLDYGSYLHKKYMTLAFKNEVKKAKSDDELADIKTRAERYYDLIFESWYGDVEPLDYFMGEILEEDEKGQ